MFQLGSPPDCCPCRSAVAGLSLALALTHDVDARRRLRRAGADILTPCTQAADWLTADVLHDARYRALGGCQMVCRHRLRAPSPTERHAPRSGTAGPARLQHRWRDSRAFN